MSCVIRGFSMFPASSFALNTTAISSSVRSDSPRKAGEFLTSTFQIFFCSLVSQRDGAPSSPLAFGSRSLAAYKLLLWATESGLSCDSGFLGLAINVSIYFVVAIRFLGNVRKAAARAAANIRLEMGPPAGSHTRLRRTKLRDAVALAQASAISVSCCSFGQGEGSGTFHKDKPVAEACRSTSSRRTTCIATGSAAALNVVRSPAISYSPC